MLSFVQMAPFELRAPHTDPGEIKHQHLTCRVCMSDIEDKHEHSGDQLYHVLLTTSHLKHDINLDVQNLRICGTYTSLSTAKAAAHRCLFEAGYEQEWFTTFQSHPDPTKSESNGLTVYAVARDGTTFSVSIDTTPNVRGYWSQTGKVGVELYHVLQTIVYYGRDESGETRETIIEGSFESYMEAWNFARSVLLCKDDGLSKDNFAEYDEAGPGETDSGFGENVVVHAVGQNGENFLITVLKGQEMESVRLAEAARRMRE